jgi:hypothetical protein
MNYQRSTSIKLILFLGGIVVLLFIANLVWNGTATVTPTNPKTDFEVVVGDYTLKPGASQKLRPGKYTVVIRGKRINQQKKSVTVTPFGKIAVTNDQKEMTDAQLVSKLSGVDASAYTLQKITYFENNSWLVAITSLKEDPLTSAPIIAKYQLGEWIVIDNGTGIEFSGDNGLPASVNSYFKGDTK